MSNINNNYIIDITHTPHTFTKQLHINHEVNRLKYCVLNLMTNMEIFQITPSKIFFKLSFIELKLKFAYSGHGYDT